MSLFFNVSPAFFAQVVLAYLVSYSLRFDGSADYLINTFGSPTNNKVWTFSGWFKRASTGSRQFFFNTVTLDDTQQLYSEFDANSKIRIRDYPDDGNFYFGMKKRSLGIK